MHLCICICGVKLQDLLQRVMLKNNGNLILYLAIAILVGLVIHLYTDDDSDEYDSILNQHKAVIELMKKEVAEEKRKADSMSIERDSTIARLLNKEKEDKEVIHEKFEKKRSDILILSDDESVQLLSKNLKGI